MSATFTHEPTVPAPPPCHVGDLVTAPGPARGDCCLAALARVRVRGPPPTPAALVGLVGASVIPRLRGHRQSHFPPLQAFQSHLGPLG
jgi:hypothetical protein